LRTQSPPAAPRPLEVNGVRTPVDRADGGNNTPIARARKGRDAATAGVTPGQDGPRQRISRPRTWVGLAGPAFASVVSFCPLGARLRPETW
jgi:hypothetical protein